MSMFYPSPFLLPTAAPFIGVLYVRSRSATGTTSARATNQGTSGQSCGKQPTALSFELPVAFVDGLNLVGIQSSAFRSAGLHLLINPSMDSARKVSHEKKLPRQYRRTQIENPHVVIIDKAFTCGSSTRSAASTRADNTRRATRNAHIPPFILWCCEIPSESISAQGQSFVSFSF